jgi:hypothetical protein
VYFAQARNPSEQGGGMTTACLLKDLENSKQLI